MKAEARQYASIPQTERVQGMQGPEVLAGGRKITDMRTSLSKEQVQGMRCASICLHDRVKHVGRRYVKSVGAPASALITTSRVVARSVRDRRYASITAKACGGSGICHHNRQKSRCKECQELFPIELQEMM